MHREYQDEGHTLIILNQVLTVEELKPLIFNRMRQPSTTIALMTPRDSELRTAFFLRGIGGGSRPLWRLTDAEQNCLRLVYGFNRWKLNLDDFVLL